MGRTACTEPQCLYSTAIPLLPQLSYGLYRASVPVQYSYTSTSPIVVGPVQSLSACTVQLYLYSPYGPCGLYRASVPVQYSYTSTSPIVVRPLQSLSACTVELYLYSPYGPYGLFKASVPVQGCTLPYPRIPICTKIICVMRRELSYWYPVFLKTHCLCMWVCMCVCMCVSTFICRMLRQESTILESACLSSIYIDEIKISYIRRTNFSGKNSEGP